jgi:hypothetical protein
VGYSEKSIGASGASIRERGYTAPEALLSLELSPGEPKAHRYVRRQRRGG